LVNAVDVFGRESTVVGGVALGYGWGVSYAFGAYFDYHSPVAFSDTSLNHRFAISYTGNDWAITANVIYGTHLESVTDRPQLSPCPIPASVQFPTGLGCNPDFINVDLNVAGAPFGPPAAAPAPAPVVRGYR
jgi:hypothetical protein